MFCIEKDTRGGVLYAPFACAFLVYPSGVEPELDGVGGRNVIQLHHGYIDKENPNCRVLCVCRLIRSSR